MITSRVTTNLRSKIDWIANRLALWCGLGWCILVCAFTSAVSAQTTDEILDQIGITGTLLDYSPFDVITVTPAAGGKSVQVNLLDLPNRRIPTSPKPTDRITCVISIFPDRTYEIFWKDIAKVTLWEQMLLERSKALLTQKRFSEAFEHLNYLLENYPQIPGLDGLQQDFLFSSARDMASGGANQHALATLEELHRRFPSYRASEIKNAISGVAGRLAEELIQQKNYAVTRSLLNRLDTTYSGQLSVVSKYRSRLTELANQFRQEALELQKQQNYLAARRSASYMLEIDPDIVGGRELLLELIKAYPMVRVGVLQPSPMMDHAENLGTTIGDWPAARQARLISTPLFTFRSVGAEGGVYQFAYGTSRLSDDRLSVELNFQRSNSNRIPNSLFVSQKILDRVDPKNESYQPSLAAILKSVSVPTPDRLTINLREPHVIPQALLQWSLEDTSNRPNEETPASTSTFNRAYYKSPVTNPEGLSYEWNGESQLVDFQPRVVQEIHFSAPSDAISSLLRGDIEVIDRLFPADARRLRGQTSIRVEPYALPTVHMLVPKSQNPYVLNADFRRALLYALDRTSILNDELLGGVTSPLDRLVSGPFPIGEGETDALSYAYNVNVPPIAYDPRSASVLLTLTKANLQAAAAKKKQSPPEIPHLRLAVPKYEAAVVAGQAILQSWKVLGIDGSLVTYDRVGEIEEGSVDFLYLTAAVWEPVTDVEMLLGEAGPAATNNAYVVQSLIKLKAANNWREVKDGCHELHSMVAAHLPVLPLWQVSEYLAYRSDLQGISKKPVGLYQDVQRWRIQPQ